MPDSIVRLPILATSKMVALPDIPFVIQAFSSYDKNLLSRLNSGDKFVIGYSQNIDPYGDFDNIVLPGVRSNACMVEITEIFKDTDSIKVRGKGLKPVSLRNFSLDDENNLVTAEVGVRIDYRREFADVEKADRDFLNKYAQLCEKSKELTPIPDDILSLATCFENRSYILATFFGFDIQRCIYFLEERDPLERYRVLTKNLSKYDMETQIDLEIQKKVNDAMDKNQREFILREKMKAVKDELKEFDGGDFTDQLEKKMQDEPDYFPENIKKRITSEIGKYRALPTASQESGVISQYLELISNLPWKEQSQDINDLKKVKETLDKNHNGLDKQKDRILQYLAVKQLTNSLKAPILCLYGAPGVGKTSLAISIAEALGRKFVKVALGGISDEAEIRGHRKTYVGAMPGRIISSLQKCGTNNPVFLLDEIDKIDRGGYKGDPSNALLEVLDPEQNSTFTDNYLDEPFDLSNVLFICTANDINDIPIPLMDRLELIELNTYTKYQKLDIARTHLIKLEEEANGIKPGMMEWENEALEYIIENYTMEAGVREFRRKIGTIDRKFAVKFLEDPSINHLVVTKKVVREYLEKEVYLHEKNLEDSQIGAINGLAFTQAGGEVLKIEVNTFPGKGTLILTGSMGDVMKEACETALSYVRSIGPKLGIDPAFFTENDIHIHFPETAQPKDGPSAGAATVMCIISAICKVKVRNDVAMTGEVDLRGNVMPIGGLREKSNAAAREHIKKIFIPHENHRDLDDLPKEIKEALEIVEVKKIEDLFPGVFLDDIAAKKAEIQKETASKSKKDEKSKEIAGNKPVSKSSTKNKSSNVKKDNVRINV